MLKYMLPLAATLLSADTAEMRIGADLTVNATVQGLPARLQIDPGGAGVPVMDPEFAARAALKSGMFGSVARVGPVKLSGRSAVIRFDFGQGEFKRRVIWFPAPMAKGFDGLIGPASVPADIVRFDLRPPAPGERETSYPLADFGFSGMGLRIPIGEHNIDVQLSLRRERSIATAATGAAIAEAHGGRMDGATSRAMIELQVERPVRHLSLATPLAVGPFAVDGMMVRVGDFGSAAGIPDADAAAPDPDEIVVTAKQKQKQRLTLDIGRDYLDRCSSIVFDKPAKLVRLRCR